MSNEVLDRRNIWQERQNRPTLIVRDLAQYVEPGRVYETLLRRGVFKWLSARRAVIKAKDRWKGAITASIAVQAAAKVARDWSAYHYQRGYRKALEECRADIREICHGDRWDCPDIDQEAVRWLAKQEGTVK